MILGSQEEKREEGATKPQPAWVFRGQTKFSLGTADKGSSLALSRRGSAALDMGARDNSTQTGKQMVEIGEFVDGLKALPHFMPAEVYEYVKKHPVMPESLSPYMFFSQARR